jgi:hypothetical protein
LAEEPAEDGFVSDHVIAEGPLPSAGKLEPEGKDGGAKPNVRYQSADQGPLWRQLNVDLADHSFRVTGGKM